jgi:hypothetical protein
MAFAICFKNEQNQYLDDDPMVPSAIGRIVAGQLDEEFVSSLYEWSKEAYQSQWLNSLERFLAGDQKAVLITWYVNPKESSNLHGGPFIEVRRIQYISRTIFRGTATSIESFQPQRRAASCMID